MSQTGVENLQKEVPIHFLLKFVAKSFCSSICWAQKDNLNVESVYPTIHKTFFGSCRLQLESGPPPYQPSRQFTKVRPRNTLNLSPPPPSKLFLCSNLQQAAPTSLLLFPTWPQIHWNKWLCVSGTKWKNNVHFLLQKSYLINKEVNDFFLHTCWESFQHRCFRMYNWILLLIKVNIIKY